MYKRFLEVHIHNVILQAVNDRYSDVLMAIIEDWSAEEDDHSMSIDWCAHVKVTGYGYTTMVTICGFASLYSGEVRACTFTDMIY